MYIARERNNDLIQYTHEPKKTCGFHKTFRKIKGDCWKIDPELYPELTFENSPMKVGIIYQERK